MAHPQNSKPKTSSPWSATSTNCCKDHTEHSKTFRWLLVGLQQEVGRRVAVDAKACVCEMGLLENHRDAGSSNRPVTQKKAPVSKAALVINGGYLGFFRRVVGGSRQFFNDQPPKPQTQKPSRTPEHLGTWCVAFRTQALVAKVLHSWVALGFRP